MNNILLFSKKTGYFYPAEIYAKDMGNGRIDYIILHRSLKEIYVSLPDNDRPERVITPFDLTKWNNTCLLLAMECKLGNISAIGEMTGLEWQDACNKDDLITAKNPIAICSNRAFDKAFIQYMQFFLQQNGAMLNSRLYSSAEVSIVGAQPVNVGSPQGTQYAQSVQAPAQEYVPQQGPAPAQNLPPEQQMPTQPPVPTGGYEGYQPTQYQPSGQNQGAVQAPAQNVGQGQAPAQDQGQPPMYAPHQNAQPAYQNGNRKQGNNSRQSQKQDATRQGTKGQGNGQYKQSNNQQANSAKGNGNRGNAGNPTQPPAAPQGNTGTHGQQQPPMQAQPLRPAIIDIDYDFASKVSRVCTEAGILTFDPAKKLWFCDVMPAQTVDLQWLYNEASKEVGQPFETFCGCAN